MSVCWISDFCNIYTKFCTQNAVQIIISPTTSLSIYQPLLSLCYVLFPGYGHIYPATNTGRALTIVYAIIGIPMFLILLADFGKLFTRGIKFLWAYVRRLYYTGSIRRVRKQAQVQVSNTLYTVIVMNNFPLQLSITFTHITRLSHLTRK